MGRSDLSSESSSAAAHGRRDWSFQGTFHDALGARTGAAVAVAKVAAVEPLQIAAAEAQLLHSLAALQSMGEAEGKGKFSKKEQFLSAESEEELKGNSMKEPPVLEKGESHGRSEGESDNYEINIPDATD